MFSSKLSPVQAHHEEDQVESILMVNQLSRRVGMVREVHSGCSQPEPSTRLDEQL